MSITYQVYSNIILMLKYREMKLLDAPLSQEMLTKTMSSQEYVKIESTRTKNVRGDCHLITYQVYPNSKYCLKSGDFEKLITDVINKTKATSKIEILYICYNEPSTHISRKLVSLQTEHKISIEYITYNIFMLELPKHVLVPEHRIMTQQEINSLTNRIFINPKQFQKILSSDPMAIWMGIKPGMFVHIKRLSDLCGQEDAYRICI